jgi:putative transposase
MKRKRHSPEQIVRKLRSADAEFAAGKGIEEVCRKLGIAENTYYRWKQQYGGVQGNELKRLRELEKENTRLKKAVADLTLDKQILQEADRARLPAGRYG